MTWLFVLTTLVKVVGMIADYLHRQGIMDEATQLLLAKQLVDIAKRVGVANEVRKEVEAMSDADVDAELQRRGWMRDDGPVPKTDRHV